MLKVSYHMTHDTVSREFLGYAPTWGTTLNGRFLTAKISESHKTGSESSLSDILQTEEEVEEKYFLSPQATQRMVLKD